MSRLAFFDIDGVLSAPGYDVNGEIRIGMSDEDWILYCIRYGKNSYDYCRPVGAAGEYARKLREEGTELFVLSTSQTSGESDGKRAFVRKYFADLFPEENVYTVARDELKLEVIAAIALLRGVPLKECELVDDTFSLLLKAEGQGIRGTHIAQVIDIVYNNTISARP